MRLDVPKQYRTHALTYIGHAHVNKPRLQGCTVVQQQDLSRMEELHGFELNARLLRWIDVDVEQAVDVWFVGADDRAAFIDNCQGQ
jgi:hypothetical protein